MSALVHGGCSHVGKVAANSATNSRNSSPLDFDPSTPIRAELLSVLLAPQPTREPLTANATAIEANATSRIRLRV
jgi:hypothetical protein